jgi:hypothetical protein
MTILSLQGSWLARAPRQDHGRVTPAVSQFLVRALQEGYKVGLTEKELLDYLGNATSVLQLWRGLEQTSRTRLARVPGTKRKDLAPKKRLD